MAGITAEKWQILDFSKFQGSVSAERGALVVRNDEIHRSVPVADVAVVLIGVNVRFSTGAMHRLLDNDIAVIFCDWKGVPYGGSYTWSTHSRIGARTLAQANASAPKRKSAWKQITKAKILGQAQVLDYCKISGGERLRNLANSVHSGDTSNAEGQAAKAYWQALWGETGFKRRAGTRNNEFPVNSLLDYGYTILRGHAMRAVLAAGLSPTLGMFHHNRANNFSLADDIIEPFRPAIDACIATKLAHSSLEEKEARALLVNAAGSTFSNTGNSIPAEMTALAQRYAQVLEEQVSKLKVNHWMPCSGNENE